LPNKGFKHSEESRRKISIALTGRKIPREQADRVNAANRGRKRSSEQRERIAKSHIGNHNALGYKHSEETCKYKIGANNPNWNGGSSYSPYCPKFNEQLKEEIRSGFNRKCFLCEKTEKDNGKRLDVHHCDYNKGQGCGLKWNLVPLCHTCHLKTNTNRHYYFNLLANHWAMNSEINLFLF
jgi:hypothetical protein